MFSIDSILVATDLTERSTVALRRAAWLKQRLGATLTVLHAREEAGATDPGKSSAAIDALQKQVGDILEGDSRRVWLRVIEGQHAAAIIAEAETAADLIVLGDGRKPGWRERFVGTTTERVVRMSDRPVLVVRPHTGPYQRLLSAYDGSPAACRALGVALQIAQEARCRVLYARERGTLVEFATREVGDALLEQQVQTVMTALQSTLQQVALPPPEPQVHVVDGNAHFLVRDHIGDFRPDLVAVGTHARSAGV